MLRIMAQSILCLVVSLSPSYSIDLEHMHYGSHFSNRDSLLNLYYLYSLSTPATNRFQLTNHAVLTRLIFDDVADSVDGDGDLVKKKSEFKSSNSSSMADHST